MPLADPSYAQKRFGDTRLSQTAMAQRATDSSESRVAPSWAWIDMPC
jgi:hypothetical protein